MRKKILQAAAVGAFCESSAMLLHAGIQIDEVLLLLTEEAASDELSEAIRALSAQMEQGCTMAEAMTGTGAFPEYACRMIRVGEMSGQLEDVLQHLAAYYRQEKELILKIRTAVRYPMAMLLVITVVLLVMVFRILPVFTDVYENIAGSLASPAYRYVTLANTICRVTLLLMGLLLLLALLLSGMSHSTDGRKRLQNLLEKLPITGTIMEELALYRFTAALAVALSSGEDSDSAVQSSLRMVPGSAALDRLGKCRDLMQEGEGFAAAAYHARLFEPVYGRMLLAGARSGNLDAVLTDLSGRLAEDAVRRIEELIDVIDPVLSAVLLLSAGLSLISVMLPLVGIMGSIG